MNHFIAIKKPDSISYEEIHELLYAAHDENRKKGIFIKTANMSGKELEKHIGENGTCFVVMDGSKLAGVIAVRDVIRNKWYAKGHVLDQIILGVSPEYTGKHISSILHEKVVEYAIQNNYNAIEARVAHQHINMQNLDRHWGFRYVDYISFKGIDHYTTVLYKWVHGCPYSQKYCDFRFNLKKILVHLRYKPGKQKRFGI